MASRNTDDLTYACMCVCVYLLLDAQSSGCAHEPSAMTGDVDDQVLQVQARSFEQARTRKEEEDLLRAIAASLEEN